MVDLVFRLEGLQDFVGLRIAHHLGRRIVELVDVDVVPPEPLQRPLEGEGNVSRIEVHSDASVIEIAADLGGDVHTVSTGVKRLSEDFFAVTPPVHVRGVKEVDTHVDRPVDRGD